MVKIVWNPKLLESAAVGAAAAAAAIPVIQASEEDAPHRTGHLAGSLAGEWVQNADGRWVYRIFAQDFKAGWVEFGTVNQPANHFLSQAALRVLGNVH